MWVQFIWIIWQFYEGLLVYYVVKYRSYEHFLSQCTLVASDNCYFCNENTHSIEPVFYLFKPKLNIYYSSTQNLRYVNVL